jgi:hypothetical protein
MADEGYPWQLSVHIVPDEIEKVHPNQEVTINGLNLIGPGHIFRKSSIREVSFCAVGADRGTNAVVFNIGGTPPKPNKPDIKEGVKMNLNDSGPVDRDLALKTLNDEKNNLAVKCSQLETEKASLIADAAELRNVKKSLEFELQTVKDSLARSQAEAQTLRDEKVTFTKASREAILVEDYKRLGVTFDAKNPEMAAVLVADEPVFQAFRLTLGAIQKAPVSPPEGAFKSVVPQLPDDMDTKFSLAELAKSRRKANNVEVN